MKNVLLYYSFSFSFGGGEHLPLALIAALQNRTNLTLALDMKSYLEPALKTIDFDLDLSNLKVVQVTPPDYNPKRHRVWDSFYRFRQLKRLAKEADICISTSNIMDFGKPAHHFINMLAFGDDSFVVYAQNCVGQKVCHTSTGKLKRFLSEKVLRPILGMRSKKSIICDPREHIYPNSCFVKKLMTDYYGAFNSSVFYPPTLFEAGATTIDRDPLKLIYIGRIVPEKRIEKIINIVENARMATGLNLKLHVAGRIDQSPSYGEQLQKMATERDWLKLLGALYGVEKQDFLMSGSYAIHAERFEAFGISIVEYLKSGNIVIVPDKGGAREIVDSPELTYHAEDEAVAILSKLLTDVAFREKQLRHCRERAELFSRKAYLERQEKLLQEIIQFP